MNRLRRLFARIPREQAGQDLVEYGMLVGLIALAAVGAVTLTGTNINGIWTALAAALPF